MKKSKGKMHDIAKPAAVKKGSAPFAASWGVHNAATSHGAGLTSTSAGSQTQWRDVSRKGVLKSRGSRGS